MHTIEFISVVRIHEILYTILFLSLFIRLQSENTGSVYAVLKNSSYRLKQEVFSVTSARPLSKRNQFKSASISPKGVHDVLNAKQGHTKY